MSKFIVYKAVVLGETVYIGSGALGREKHCASGCSHVYELNKYHFEGVHIEVSVIKKGLTKEESLQIEKELIQKIRPRFNKVHLTKDNLKSAQIAIFLSQRLNLEFKNQFGRGKQEQSKAAIPEIISFMGISNLISGVTIPPEGDARFHLKSARARTLYGYITRKDFKEKYQTWLETVFEYEAEGKRVKLKLKEEVLEEIKSMCTI